MDATSRRHRIFGIALLVAVLAAGAAISYSRIAAEDPLDTATTNLQDLAGQTPDDTVAARVNGEPIRRSELDVLEAAQPANQAADRDPAGTLRWLIDSRILAQEAERRGIVVDGSEVTELIELALVEPLNSGDMPPEQEQVLRASLEALGVDLTDLSKDPHIRAEYRAWILRGRLLEGPDDRDELLAELRKTATVDIVDPEFEQLEATYGTP